MNTLRMLSVWLSVAAICAALWPLLLLAAWLVGMDEASTAFRRARR